MGPKTPRRENLQDPVTGQMSKGPLSRYGYKNKTSFIVISVNDAYRDGYDKIDWSDDGEKKCRCKTNEKEIRESSEDEERGCGGEECRKAKANA